jgi:SAM-dependent methyltransferase
MQWTTKARIQALLSRLPEALGNPVYYALQKAAGSFREPRNVLFQNAAIAFVGQLRATGRSLHGQTILEIGTGRRITLPVCLWLMGAGRIHTVDLHRYLRDSIVIRDLRALVRDRDFLDREEILRPRADALRALVEAPWRRRDLLTLCGIDYLAPADATTLPLSDRSIDLHLSYTVFEHIPGPCLHGILTESSRLLRPRGLAIHLIDHSDHFSHGDSSLSPLHFLRYDDAAWARIADNRYMYMNRLRADDYRDLYQAAGHEIVRQEDIRDESLREQLVPPVYLAKRFAEKTTETLVTTTSWITSRPRP